MSIDIGLWNSRWSVVLEYWSRHARIPAPTWFDDPAGPLVTAAFHDRSIRLNRAAIEAQHLADFPREVLALAAGYLTYCPATARDYAALLAFVRAGLPETEEWAETLAWWLVDLLVAAKLRRDAGLSLVPVLFPRTGVAQGIAERLRRRIGEILLDEPAGSLAAFDPGIEEDARLGARVVTVFARNWIEGGGRWAALFLPHLCRETAPGGGAGFETADVPFGLSGVNPRERAAAVHPSLDPMVVGGDPEARAAVTDPPNYRDVAAYRELMKWVNPKASDDAVLTAYYRERALPYLIRFPSAVLPANVEPQLEGIEPWDIGSPIEEADWMETVMTSPRVIPGFTTVRRGQGPAPGTVAVPRGLDLDLYLDSSRSMPNPRDTLSFPVLAGFVFTLSALRAGARVRVTQWSGAANPITTTDFLRDEATLLPALLGYIGGGTDFPIDLLAERYAESAARDRTIVIVSDVGIAPLFSVGDDRHTKILGNAGGGATVVLNLDTEPRNHPFGIKALRLGWSILRAASWDDVPVLAGRFCAERLAR